jgi:DNA-binding SARP family transcriptional activator
MTSGGGASESAVAPGERTRDDAQPIPPRTGLWFSVLGPVRCWRDGVELDLGSPAQRALVGALLLREGRAVTTDEIVEAMWAQDAPPSVNGVLRTYVYRLRKLLSAAADGEPMIRSVGGGYILPVAEDRVDFRLFARRVSQARSARGEDLAQARELLHQALSLWSGTPLSGLRGPYPDRQRRRLEQDRFGAWEDRLCADVELGHHHEVIPELVAAVADHPLRERLRELLMLALYRAGRQAEALEAYTDAHRTLDEELGVGPGAGLRRLHERILRMDATLDLPADPVAASSSATPAQLPPDIPDFVGRAAEIAEITRLLSVPDRAPAVGLAGLGGMGKTTLAVRCAHLLREQFPDGQLFVDLGARNGTPAAPRDVLAGFLRACGVPAAMTPESLGERAALWRTITAGRRMLIVLDDAADGEQIRHLLPAAAGSASIVTTWRRFIGLPGMNWLAVDVLPADDALTLLGLAAGEARVAAEIGSASRLVAACSHQPLAVRVAAARLLDRPQWSVREIELQLYEDLRQPVVMDDDCAIVDAPLQHAEDRLADDVAAAFRLLAVPDCDRFTVAAAAAILELPHIRARATLERLVDAHLLVEDTADSYHYHGLIKAYARRQARVVYGAERCCRALRALVEYYTVRTRAAVEALNAGYGPAEGPHAFASVNEAEAWLADTKDDILAVLDQSHDVPEERISLLKSYVLTAPGGLTAP